jgi:tetratricopeptide (TPR) repeat protein
VGRIQPAKEPIGSRIRRLRNERGLSQRAITGPGVSISYVSRVESGERIPSMKALRVIAPKLGVSTEYLETGVEPGELEARLAEAELELRVGDPAAALERFRDLAADAEAAGASAITERARIGLGLAHAGESRHAEAITAFEDVLADRQIPVAERPDVYATLGRCHLFVGEPSRAAYVFHRCLEEIERSEIVDHALYVRFATSYSYALTDMGDLPAANQALVGALGHAEGLSDRYTEIRLYWSLARLYGVQGPPELALSYYRKAIALLETTEDRFHLARAHEACASALLDGGDPEAARDHLDVAERIFAEQSQRPYVGSVQVERARLELQSGNLEEARRAALGALDLLDEGVTSADDVGSAWRTLAEIFATMDENDLAESSYGKAIELLESGASAKYLADAYRSYADYLHSAGRETEAFDILKRAVGLTSAPTHA